jgi:hypothetical protein
MWQTIRRYIWWTERRGSFHYDVMVTLILAFLFIAPRVIDFRDQPRPGQRTDVPGETEKVVDAAGLPSTSSDGLESALHRAAGLSPKQQIEHYDELRDSNGNIAAYRVFITMR